MNSISLLNQSIQKELDNFKTLQNNQSKNNQSTNTLEKTKFDLSLNKIRDINLELDTVFLDT